MRKLLAILIIATMLLTMNIALATPAGSDTAATTNEAVVNPFADIPVTPFYLESAGVTIQVPVGMIAEDASTDVVSVLKMAVEGRDDLTYVYSLARDEAYAGKWLENLTEEELAAFQTAVATVIVNPSILTASANGINYLVIGDETGKQLHYVSLLNGWVCDVAVVKTSAEVLNEDEIILAAALLTSITFDEVAAQ